MQAKNNVTDKKAIEATFNKDFVRDFGTLKKQITYQEFVDFIKRRFENENHRLKLATDVGEDLSSHSVPTNS